MTKGRLSSFSDVELSVAYQSLCELKRSICIHKEPDSESLEQEIDRTISLMSARLREVQTSTGMTIESLIKMNITMEATGFITLKPNLEERVAASCSLGEDELWSSQSLYRHLDWLENLIPRTAKASACAWIDAFFFRVSAMLTAPNHMLLNMEHAPTISLSSSTTPKYPKYVDYTAAVMTGSVAGASALGSSKVHSLSGFFVTEVKTDGLMDHIPQAVYETYTRGKNSNKKVLRGALTNGHQWVFILVNFNDNYNGATYMYSQMIELQTTRDDSGRVVISKPEPDLIAGILLNWIENSFDGFRDDDWFE